MEKELFRLVVLPCFDLCRSKSFHVCTCMYVCLSVCLSNIICMSVCLCVCLSVCLYVCLSVCLMSVCLHLSVSLSNGLLFPPSTSLQWGFSDVNISQSIPPGTKVGPVTQIRTLFTVRLVMIVIVIS